MTHEYLNSVRTIATLRGMTDGSQTGILCTFSEEQSYPMAESMLTRDMDIKGNLWYLLSSESNSFKNVQQNNQIKVIFTAPLQSQFLSIVGTAEISNNEKRINQYWTQHDERQFTEGRSDPRIRLLKITVDFSHCINFPSNNMMDILKLLGRTIGGREDYN